MKAIQRLRNLGQSIWLDQTTRELLNSGKLRRYIGEWSVSGATTNIMSYKHAILNTPAYDEDIQKKLIEDKLGEDLYVDLVLEDIRIVADLLRPIYDQSNGEDGWVSLEISPLILHDQNRALAAAQKLYTQVQRPNCLIKIPGTTENLSTIEEAIFTGVPVHVTLLFSQKQYPAAVEAFLQGIERRIDSGLTPSVGSVASVSIEKWGAAARSQVPEKLFGQLGMAMAGLIYKTSCAYFSSTRWERAHKCGAQPQRLVWADALTENCEAAGGHGVLPLCTPMTVNILSAAKIKALAISGEPVSATLTNGADWEALLSRYAETGVDFEDIAAKLQEAELETMTRSWFGVLSAIAYKSASLTSTNHTIEERSRK